MKKYGVYVHVNGSKMAPWLIREYDTLKDAVREAYSLARYRFGNPVCSNEFIVGNNTGITLNSLTDNEIIRYSVERFIVFDDVYRSIEVYWGNKIKHSFYVKVGH